MSFLFNKRLITALAISFALHSMLFLLGEKGGHRTIVEVQGTLRVSLTPLQKSQSAEAVTPSTQQVAPAAAASSVDAVPGLVSALPAEDHYFLFQEVDKKSDFIYSEPVAQLEKIMAADTEMKFTVKLLINEEGLVDSVTVLEAVPSAIYNEEVVKALLQSRFSPAEKAGKKVKSQKILEIKFAVKGAI